MATACGTSGGSPGGAPASASPRPSPTSATDPVGNFVFTDGSSLSLVRLGDGKIKQVYKYSDASSIAFPSVSPNGRRIAFSLQKPAAKAQNGAGSEIAVVDVGGANLHEVASHSRQNEYLQSPVWLNDDEILFDVRGTESGTKAYFRIDKLNLTTGARTTFIDNAIRPAISRDRTMVAYDAIAENLRERVYVAGVDLSGARPLTGDETKIVLITSLAISPDNKTVAFAAQDLPRTSSAPSREPSGDEVRVHALAAHPGAQDIWVVNVDGSGLRKVSDLADVRPSTAFGTDPSVLFVLSTSGLWRVLLPDGEPEKIPSPVGFGDFAAASP